METLGTFHQLLIIILLRLLEHFSSSTYTLGTIQFSLKFSVFSAHCFLFVIVLEALFDVKLALCGFQVLKTKHV